MQAQNPPSSRGRHRKCSQRLTLIGTSAVALSLVYGGVAHADPTQPGIAPAPVAPQSDEQPGVIATPPPSAVGDPGSTSDWQYVPLYEPPAEYRNAPTRSVPSGTEPASYTTTPAPRNTEADPAVPTPSPTAPGAPVAPIQAADNTVRFGAVSGEKPAWLSQNDADRVNNTAAVFEAQGATYFNSLGFETTRSDRMAAGTTAGAVIGFTVAAGVTYAIVAPLAAVGGALIGGTVGGVTAATAAGVVLPGVGLVPGGVVGTAGGAAAGAAVGAAASLVPALGAGALGGAAGALIGGAYGAGENLGEAPTPPSAPAPAPSPAPAPLAPALPAVDTEAVAAATAQAAGRVETLPGGTRVVDTARTVVDNTPQWTADATEVAAQHVSTVRDQVSARPGGSEVVSAVDTVVAQNAPAVQIAAAPIVDQATALLGAVAAGLHA